MSIISSRNSATDPLSKFVGVFLPLQLSTSITIYGLVHNINKTKLIKKILLEWIEKNYSKKDEENYLSIISESLYQQYLEIQTTTHCMSYRQFTNTLLEELKNKGLPIPIIEILFKKLDILHIEHVNPKN